MIGTPELIQEQMKETKSQLSNKLESLEQQLHVADAVQTTRTAVAATAEAVQATAATVSGAMQSVSEAFDVRRQIAQHPWVALGGAAALGYVAHQLMSDSQQKAVPPLDDAATLAELATDQASEQQGHPINLAATAAATRAYNETLMMSSPLLQLKGLAINTLVGIARESAALAVPLVAAYLATHLNRPASQTADAATTATPQSAAE
jgi:hypothetical protein